MIIDNAKCAITKACVYDPQVQRSYAECAEAYAFKIDACSPQDPAKKGIVESSFKYIKRSFLALRQFRDLADANRQVLAWVMEDTGNRLHATTSEVPLKRFAQVEKALLRPLRGGAARLETACSRANHYGIPGYRVVKAILERG